MNIIDINRVNYIVQDNYRRNNNNYFSNKYNLNRYNKLFKGN